MKRTTLSHPCRPHPHLYQINTMVWLYELSEKMKTTIRLGDVPDQEWDNLQSKGLDYVWLMGMWERSPTSRYIAQQDPRLRKEYDHALPGWKPADVVGSPYSIRSYNPDPEIATWDQLDGVLEKLHRRGMRLILDFVPNHTARDHDWVCSHPEYYIQRTTKNPGRANQEFFKTECGNEDLYLAHGKDPYFPAWTDTAQLNYFCQATRTAMIDELKTIAQHCDGVRCDMAMLVLNEIFQKTWSIDIGTSKPPGSEFWTEAITAVSEPDFVWIAEVYWDLEWILQQLGFHFTYDKRLYDRLCHASPREVAEHLQADISYQQHLVRFIENHDEPRGALMCGNNRLSAIASLMATLPGMRMFHHGQLEGKRIRPPVQLRRVKEEDPDPDTFKMYDRLLHITDEEVFHGGQWKRLTIRSAGDFSFENLISYQWQAHTVQKVVVVNLGSVESQGFLDIFGTVDHTEEEHNLGATVVVCDQLTAQKYESSYSDIVRQGLYVSLKPFTAHVFALS